MVLLYEVAASANDPVHAFTIAEIDEAMVDRGEGVPARARVKLRHGDTAPNPKPGAAPFGGPCRVTFYRLADGSHFTGTIDTSTRSTPACDASGAEIRERIISGDKSAAMAWLERCGSWPSSDAEIRDQVRLARGLLGWS